jgi:hypothetical protein
MATIIVFASSLLILSIFLILKALELKSGNKNLLLGLISKFETEANLLVKTLKFRSLQLNQTVRYLVFVKSKLLWNEIFNKIHLAILAEYRKRQEVIMGRKNIANKGSVSFYLKKITEDKKEGHTLPNSR